VVTTDFDHNELVVDADQVQWRGQTFANVIFATGWEAMRHPWFDWVPFLPVRGTILTARADLRGERRIMSQGCWVVPREDGTLRIGSTYETTFDSPNGFDETKLAQLHETLRRFVKVPVEIVDQQAAVRPSIEGQLTLIGRHPGKERVAFLNGMGSKGTLLSPLLSRLLMGHLIDGVAVPAEFDLRGNW
jgi:glycine/D-amino acid oxidase-like deaminating enzyme